MSKGVCVYRNGWARRGIYVCHYSQNRGVELLEVTGGVWDNPFPPFSQSSGYGGDISVGASSLSLSLPDRWELLAQIWRAAPLPSQPLAVQPVSIATPPSPARLQ